MQTGRIPPILRQFFTATKPATTATAKDSNGQQSGYQAPDQDATEDEAKRAAEALNASEEFQKNSLRAEAVIHLGKPALQVTDSSGAVLRIIKGFEVLRVLTEKTPADLKRHGRILDRRI